MQQAELEVAAKLLTSLSDLLPNLTTVNERDLRMQGKLEVVVQLIGAIGNHALPSSNSQQLVQLLLTGHNHCCLMHPAKCQFCMPLLQHYLAAS